MEWLTPEAQSQQPDAAIPRFYVKQVQHKAKTLEEGRPIFVNKEYVEIRIAGDKNNVIDRPVQDRDKQRWPKIYEQFKNGAEQKQEGTPLKEWGSLPATRALELNAMNVFTVEQLAEVSDGHIQSLGMDARSLRTKAQAYIKAAKDAGFSEKLMIENQSLREDVDFLKSKMSPLLDKLEELTKQIEAMKNESTDTGA